jgi:hypothetical protein
VSSKTGLLKWVSEVGLACMSTRSATTVMATFFVVSCHRARCSTWESWGGVHCCAYHGTDSNIPLSSWADSRPSRWRAATATPRLPPGPEFCGGSRAGSACVGESSARGSGGRPARRAGWREVEASPTNSSTCPICMDKAVNPHEGARDVATFWQAGVGGAGPRRVCTHSACWPCALTHFSYPYATCALHFLEPAGSLHASMAAARGAPQRQGGRRDAAGLLGLAFAAAFRRHPRRHRRRRRDFRPFALSPSLQGETGSG